MFLFTFTTIFMFTQPNLTKLTHFPSIYLNVQTIVKIILVLFLTQININKVNSQSKQTQPSECLPKKNNQNLCGGINAAHIRIWVGGTPLPNQ